MALSTIGANQIAANSVGSSQLASGAITSAAMPAGSVLQCVTTNYPDDFQFTLSASGNTSDKGKLEIATGLNCSITPSSTSSKILYQATIYIGGTAFYDIGYHVIKNATSATAATSHTDTSPCGGSYLSDSSGNAIRGQTSNSTPRGTGVLNGHTSESTTYLCQPVSMSLLDHPNTTSQITYNFGIAFYNWDSSTLYLNRSNANQQSGQGLYDTNPVSTVVLMEIAG